MEGGCGVLQFLYWRLVLTIWLGDIYWNPAKPPIDAVSIEILKSLVWHEFMVPCRRYRNEGWLGFQLVCEHKGMVHRYRSHLLRTHKVGWEHRDLGEEALRSGYFWHGNWGIAIHVGFQHCWRILEVIVVNIRTLRDGIDGASQLWPHHGAWGRGWLDTGLQGVC